MKFERLIRIAQQEKDLIDSSLARIHDAAAREPEIIQFIHYLTEDFEQGSIDWYTQDILSRAMYELGFSFYENKYSDTDSIVNLDSFLSNLCFDDFQFFVEPPPKIPSCTNIFKQVTASHYGENCSSMSKMVEVAKLRATVFYNHIEKLKKMGRLNG